MSASASIDDIVMEINIVTGEVVELAADQWFGATVNGRYGLQKDWRAHAEGDTVLEAVQRLLPKARAEWERVTGKSWDGPFEDDARE